MTLVVAGRFTSQLGAAFYTLLMAYWILDYTHSAIWMGLLATVTQITTIVSGPLAGVLADTHPRKTLIMLSDAVRVVALVAFAASFSYPNSLFLHAILIVTTVVMSASGALLTASLVPFVADVVTKERLGPALSITRAAYFLGEILGQLFSGWLYPLIGIAACLSVNAFFYFLAALLFIWIPTKLNSKQAGAAASIAPPQPHASERKQLKSVNFFQSIKEGVLQIATNKGMVQIFCVVAVINLFVAPIAVLIPVFARYSLHTGPTFLSLLIASQSIGSLAGFILLIVAPAISKARTLSIILSLLALGVSLLAVPLSVKLPWVLACFFVQGSMTSILNVSLLSLLDNASQPHIRGRVQAAANTLSSVLMPMSSALSGIIAEALHKDVSSLWAFCGIACIGASFFFWRSYHFRVLDIAEVHAETSAV